MDREIQHLLKLSRIPGFKLLPREEQILAEWKRQQKEIEPIAPKKTRGRKKKTTNEVKESQKEIGEMEIDDSTFTPLTES